MFSRKLIKFIGLLLPLHFSYALAEISPCGVEKKLASKTLNTREVTTASKIDEVTIEFWTRRCDDEHQLIATVSPKVPGDSFITYLDTVVYQGQQPYRKHKDVYIHGAVGLHAPQSYLLKSSPIPADENKIDYGQSFDLYVTCDVCDDAKPRTLTLSPNSASILSSVTGTWYDPAYDGSGFNIVEATNGLFMYFYGYKAEENGQAQWLLSAVGPKAVTKGQAIELTVYEPTEGNGANFLTKPASGSGVSEWGKVSLTFNSCSSGTIVLDGKDGKVTHNVVKLANIKNLTCTE